MMDIRARDSLRFWLPSVLTRRLEELSPQFGKTVFMELAYLLQEVYRVPLGYRFTLYAYGPYDPVVLADLDLAKMRGLVNVDYVKADAGFKITLGPRARETTQEYEAYAGYRHELKDLVKTFGQFRAKPLDLRATINYFWKSFKPSDDDGANIIVEHVYVLKPHIDESEIKAAVEELKCNGTIQFTPKVLV